VTAFVAIWLASQGLTVTLQSQPLSPEACRAKLVELVKQAELSELGAKVLVARCEGGKRSGRRHSRRRR
jgi:hypothetical protein